MKKER
jgi:hypothetical protein